MADLNVQVDRALPSPPMRRMNAQYRATMVVMAKGGIARNWAPEGRDREARRRSDLSGGAADVGMAGVFALRFMAGIDAAQSTQRVQKSPNGIALAIVIGVLMMCSVGLSTLTRARTAELGRIEKSLGNQMIETSACAFAPIVPVG